MFDVAPAFPNSPKDNDGEIKEADTAPFKIKESVSDVLTSAFVDLRLLKKFPVFSFHFAWDDFGFQARLTTSKKPSAEKECVKLFSLFCWVHLRGLEIVCHCITEAIKRKSPSTVSCDAFQISIHSFKELCQFHSFLRRLMIVQVNLSAWLCRVAGGRRKTKMSS